MNDHYIFIMIRDFGSHLEAIQLDQFEESGRRKIQYKILSKFAHLIYKNTSNLYSRCRLAVYTLNVLSHPAILHRFLNTDFKMIQISLHAS